MHRPSQCRIRVSPRYPRGRTSELQPAQWFARTQSTQLVCLRSTTRHASPRGPSAPDDWALYSSSTSFLGDLPALDISRVELEGSAIEPVLGGEFLYGSASELAELLGGFTERNEGGDRMSVGDPEQFPYLPLFGDGHRRESAAVPFVSGCQQDV